MIAMTIQSILLTSVMENYSDSSTLSRANAAKCTLEGRNSDYLSHDRRLYVVYIRATKDHNNIPYPGVSPYDADVAPIPCKPEWLAERSSEYAIYYDLQSTHLVSYRCRP